MASLKPSKSKAVNKFNDYLLCNYKLKIRLFPPVFIVSLNIKSIYIILVQMG